MQKTLWCIEIYLLQCSNVEYSLIALLIFFYKNIIYDVCIHYGEKVVSAKSAHCLHVMNTK